MNGFYYLASPYSLHPGGTENAFREVCKAAALLINAGYTTFSPIAMTHPIATIGGLDPMDGAMWLSHDEPFMEAACGIIVLMLDGWDSSIGVRHEINRFHAMGKPIIMMVPGEVPDMDGFE